MSQDADAVMIAGNGDIYTAPVGSTLPVDPTTALDAAFIQLGYVSQDGVTWRNEQTKEPINVWQSFYAIKYRVTETSAEMEFILKQFDINTLPFAMGGGTITTTAGPPIFHTYVPPAPETIDERSVVLAWKYSTYDYRMVVPRMMVTGSIETVLSRGQESELPVTLSLLGAPGVDAFAMYTSDPAFAAA